jgi:hypothetical protein
MTHMHLVGGSRVVSRWRRGWKGTGRREVESEKGELACVQGELFVVLEFCFGGLCSLCELVLSQLC